jgi:pyruvate,water dikinase
MRQWDDFMQRYGFRGPNELDLASTRYADDPLLVLEQMRQYVMIDESAHESPQQSYERRQRERRETYRKLLEGTRNPLKAQLVRRLYRATEAFSGFREIHKYYLVMAGYEVRRRALEVGRELAERGRLDSAEQIFDLTYEDLQGSYKVPDWNLRERAHRNTRYRRKVEKTPGASFPVMVDSRGNIPRPASRAAGPGVLFGEGVSPGVARGPAKVLSRVGEKPVLPGEVLVARATDPGWTPLFVNAAGVVLETGGGFQHGALVAREYGKPCVVGIEDATERITDGQEVELDGEAGTVIFVSNPPESEG